MPFPPTPRVRYELNPIQEVICQLRYPPILRIGAEAPAAFQEVIRKDYPLYSSVRPELLRGVSLPYAISVTNGGDLGWDHQATTEESDNGKLLEHIRLCPL